MDPVTHVAAGVLISQVLPGPSRGWSALAGAAFALLPDIDYFLIFVDRLAFIRHHRGFTHSLAALFLFALLGAALGRALGGPRWFRPILLLGLAVLASHLLLDLATSYGTQILFPFSRQRFTLDWLFIIDPYLTGSAAVRRRSRPGFGHLGPHRRNLLAGRGRGLCSPLRLLSPTGPDPGSTGVSPAGRHRAGRPPQTPPHPDAARPGPGVRARASDRGRPAPALFLPPLAVGRRQPRRSAAELCTIAVTWPGWNPGRPNRRRTRLPVPAGCRVPNGGYQRPGEMQVQVWTGLPAPNPIGPPKAQKILDQYLEFARFPLLRRLEPRGDGELLEWLDLRFSVPGRDFPFVLQLQLDAAGQVQHWSLGRCANEES